jgi:hypothetical protein
MAATEQQRAALEQAAAVKAGRARLKDQIHADATWSLLADILAGDRDEELASARIAGIYVVDLLRAAPGMAAGKAGILLREVLGVYDGTEAARLRVGELRPRDRGALAVGVEVRRRRLDDQYIARVAAGDRWRTSRNHTPRKAAA